MLTGLIIGFVAGQVVGIVAAAFLFAARGGNESRREAELLAPRPGVSAPAGAYRSPSRGGRASRTVQTG